MDLGVVGTFVALLSLVGGALTYSGYFSEKAALHRIMRRTPLSDIGSLKAEMGAVRVVGRVRPLGEPMRAPLSGRPCVLSDAVALGYAPYDESRTLEVLYREVDTVDFLLEDLTGGVLVRVPRDAKLGLAKQLEWDGWGPTGKDFLERRYRESGARPGSLTKAHLLRESILEPGKRTAMVGVVHWEHDPDAKEAGAGYRGGPRRLVIKVDIAALDEP